MTTTPVHPGTGLPPAPSSPAQRRAVAVVAALAGLVLVAWVWRHPPELFTETRELTVQHVVDEPVWTSLSLMTDGPETGELPDSITVTGLEPVLERDDAAVEVEYLVCEMATGSLDVSATGAFGGAMQQADVDRLCTSTRPAVGSRLAFRTEPHQELVVGLTPTRAGTSVVAGHEISYGVGWQRGRETVDLRVELTAAP